MKLYVIPGGGETEEDPGYKDIIKAAHQKGYRTEVLNVQLRQKDIKKVLDSATKQVEKMNPSDVAILGFSSGALIAHTIATRLPIHAGYYCSLATLFNEDIPPIGEVYKNHFGETTLKQMRQQKYGVSKAARNYFFTGDSEGWKIPRRSKILAKQVDTRVITIPGTGHDLTPGYVDTVVSYL